ncbi:hypothetical protein NEDG_00941 [Nematocida displodere]|uniref:Zinc finger PHD-type domain-containing protein n=1 Tax=Nematocida displodere TaxID=1805483 RepID=A0A177ECA9_9MICR|nr:hypothetical protein NEDG_00941 [Nematocida displodere]
MDGSTPQPALEKVLEEVNPLIEKYNKATEELKLYYDETYQIRKDFLTAGIEYTKMGESDENAENGVIQAYLKYKDLLEQRMNTSKSLLSSVAGVLSTVDQQLLLLNSQYDPKFGIQTQNPRIFKTNKNNPSLSSTTETEKEPGIYCICNGPAYGDMIACDAYHTEVPWFHMECVGCTGVPRGHWLCPKCRPVE